MIAGQIFKTVEKAVGISSKRDEIIRVCNEAYYELCAMIAWNHLCQKTSIDFSGKDSNNSMLLPADMAGIVGVWDSTREYLPGSWARSQNDNSEEDTGYKWFYTEPVMTPATFAKGTVNKGAAAWSWNDTVTWDSSWVGEYVRFGSEVGVYLITGERTFSPSYYGPSLTSKYISIRPAGTKRFSISDDNGDFVENTVTVHYWKYPPPLYEDEQSILLPSSRALELLAIIRMVGTHQRRERDAEVYRKEYYGAPERPGALDLLLSQNQRPATPKSPVNRQGERLKWVR